VRTEAKLLLGLGTFFGLMVRTPTACFDTSGLALERRRPHDRTEGGEPRLARDGHPRDQTHDHVVAPVKDDCCGGAAPRRLSVSR
jgi:hypothetical protein